MRKLPQKIGLFCSIVLVLGIGLTMWRLWTQQFARWVPTYDAVVLEEFTSVDDLSQEDLSLIFAQTGLTKIALQRLEEGDLLYRIPLFQAAFFTPATESHETGFMLQRVKNSILSWEESLLDAQGNRGDYLPMVPLEVGDILLTPNSHVYGWRLGHAAMVVDAAQGITLESVVLGENSITQWVSKWNGYPAVLILRPKEEELGQIATNYALDYLQDVPYDFTVGVFSKKTKDLTTPSGTQCSHLVWQSYQWAGVDLDSDGGLLVFPENIAHSEHLELVQIWGIDPTLMWAP